MLATAVANNEYRRRLLSVSVLLITISVIAASPAATLTGKVVKIADGDTLTPLAWLVPSMQPRSVVRQRGPRFCPLV